MFILSQTDIFGSYLLLEPLDLPEPYKIVALKYMPVANPYCRSCLLPDVQMETYALQTPTSPLSVIRF